MKLADPSYPDIERSSCFLAGQVLVEVLDDFSISIILARCRLRVIEKSDDI